MSASFYKLGNYIPLDDEGHYPSLSMMNALVPRNLRWKLLMDRASHVYDDPFYFDTATFNGDGAEPGYIEAMYKAYDFAFGSIDSDRITADWLIELHDRCRPKGDSKLISKGFNGIAAYPAELSKPDEGELDLAALRKEWREEKLIFDPKDPENRGVLSKDARKNYVAILADSETPVEYLPRPSFGTYEQIAAVKLNLVEKYDQYNSSSGKEQQHAYINIRSGVDYALVMLRSYTRQLSQFAREKEHVLSTTGIAISSDEEDDRLLKIAYDFKRPAVEKAIQAYRSEIASARSDDLRLKAIVRFVRRLEVTHPFADCNQRAFTFVLLNRLLIENDFVPSIVKNPYAFDGFYTVNQLVAMVKDGFEYFKINIIDAAKGVEKDGAASVSSESVASEKSIQAAEYTEFVDGVFDRVFSLLDTYMKLDADNLNSDKGALSALLNHFTKHQEFIRQLEAQKNPAQSLIDNVEGLDAAVLNVLTTVIKQVANLPMVSEDVGRLLTSLDLKLTAGKTSSHVFYSDTDSSVSASSSPTPDDAGSSSP